MPGWTLVDAQPTPGCTFQRPLSAYEQGFYLDGPFDGTTDSIHHCELRLLNGPRDAHLFAEPNIVGAWLSTKRRHPLVGATVQRQRAGTVKSSVKKVCDHTDLQDLHFVVREHDLSVLRPREIVFGQVKDAEEARKRAAAILDGPRQLTAELLVQMYIFREGLRTDVFHLMLLVAHSVADLIADWMLMRCMLDVLARGGGSSGAQLAQMPLEDRLAMVVPWLELEPVHVSSLSVARRRWRRAAAAVIFQLRIEKMQGGYTLPCRFTRSTPDTAAKRRLVSASLTHSETAAVMETCRQYKVTFGNAFTVLAQVAMTRVLYRRFLCGEIPEEEWEHQKRQPYLVGCPINLRPYLDEAWFKKGGGGEFTLATSYFVNQLPCMTLGASHDIIRPNYSDHGRKLVLADVAPPLSVLMTFDRFLHRVELIKRRMESFLGHPLFFELMQAGNLQFSEQQRVGALRRIKHAQMVDPAGDSDKDEALTITDMPVVRACTTSTFGDIDPIFPSQYPLPCTHVLSPYCPISHPAKAGYVIPPVASPLADVAPKIMVENVRSRLHIRPGELYLSAATSYGRLDMAVSFDGNVFGEQVVMEWLDEVKKAILWYLVRVSHHGGEQAGPDLAAKAKL